MPTFPKAAVGVAEVNNGCKDGIALGLGLLKTTKGSGGR